MIKGVLLSFLFSVLIGFIVACVVYNIDYYVHPPIVYVDGQAHPEMPGEQLFNGFLGGLFSIAISFYLLSRKHVK